MSDDHSTENLTIAETLVALGIVVILVVAIAVIIALLVLMVAR